MAKSQNKLILTVIILIAIGLFFVASNTDLKITGSTTEIDKLSLCISKAAVMYGSDKCSSCLKEKELFGDSFKYINYIDCLKNKEICLNADIEKYPTWIINGEKYEGLKTLQELKELTGC